MRSSYIAAVALLACSSAWGDTIITATSTCQVRDGANNVLFADSHTVSLSAPTLHVSGLDCPSPYGSITFPTSQVVDSIALPGPFQTGLFATVDVPPVSTVLYSGMLSIHLSSQQTFIPAGGSGLGLLRGNYGSMNDGGASLVTTFGSCDSSGPCPGGPVPFSIPFTFGLPFTFAVTGDLSVTAPSLLGNAGAADISVFGMIDGAFDASGNRIAAVFTPVPEPAACIFTAAGLLAIALWKRRGRAVAAVH